jgi:hypothetical protein
MSFYWEKNIDFFRAHIRVNNIDNYRTREILRFSDHYKDDAKNSILIKKFDTFYSLIECVNYSSFETNKEILSELIPRAIKSKNVDDISAFMILYNIIEKIRNYFLSKPVESEHFMIKEEFEFKLGKKKTNEFIKNKIKEIKEIVADSDLEEFDNKASDKVTFIKKTGLKEQIDSLLNYLKLNSDAYNIELSNLIKIRNNIYHGKLPEEEINPYVEQMRILVYDLILKMIMT